MKKTTVILLACLCLPVSAHSEQRQMPEKAYQEQWCKERGQVEYVLPDKTRCDCLTETHAVEFDFGSKWAEAIGQSLYYSLQTGKRAGVVLILEGAKDHKYWVRLNSIIQGFSLPIDTWAIGNGAR